VIGQLIVGKNVSGYEVIAHGRSPSQCGVTPSA
jgi:hypothetical protein